MIFAEIESELFNLPLLDGNNGLVRNLKPYLDKLYNLQYQIMAFEKEFDNWKTPKVYSAYTDSYLEVDNDKLLDEYRIKKFEDLKKQYIELYKDILIKINEISIIHKNTIDRITKERTL